MVVPLGGQATGPTDADDQEDPAVAKGAKGPKGPRPPTLPAKYKNPTTLGLTFTAKDGPNQLDLDLKSE
jgi:hypothetical protein